MQTGGIWDHSGSKFPDWSGGGGESGEHLAFGSQCPLLSAADQRPVTLATLGSLSPPQSFSELEVRVTSLRLFCSSELSPTPDGGS